MRPFGRCLLVGFLGLVPWTAALTAQSEGPVEILATLLAATDARRVDDPVFQRAASDPDSTVRRAAARSLGALRDARTVPLLTSLLMDPDTTVQLLAAFALGQTGDRSAAAALGERMRGGQPLPNPVAVEVIGALARLGGAGTASMFREVLGWNPDGSAAQLTLMLQAAVEAWRLGPAAPVDALVGLLQARNEALRTNAAYSLGRLRPVTAGARLLDAADDRDAPGVRTAALRALTRMYADSAGLAIGSVQDVLLRGVQDRDPRVRLEALRSLATYRDPRGAKRVAALLEDSDLNIQVQAAITLGQLGGSEASAALTRVLTAGKGTFARRREALLSLGRVDPEGFRTVVAGWAAATDWRERAAAVEGWALADGTGVSAFLEDRDPRVVAVALGAWGRLAPPGDPAFLDTCRRHLASPDGAVRSAAADGVARSGRAEDVPRLVAAVHRARVDSFPDAALSALAAILTIARGQPDGPEGIEEDALGALATPQQYALRRWAEINWPRAAERWGPSTPIATGLSLEDYRGIVRRFLLPASPERTPHVRLDVDRLGVIELELYGADAPLTVASFLRLVDRRYFDGLQFHRVVPGFVVQTGDPRGDGWGGPGGAIRDEISPRRYSGYVVGLALSGPDSGGSQWFITLGPAPHLDGTYPAFGRVVEGAGVLQRITQGDRIRSMAR